MRASELGVIETEPPRTSAEQIRVFRSKCREDLCGCYGNNWSCPPGAGCVKDVEKRVNRYSHAKMVVCRFEDVDFKNDQEMADSQAFFMDKVHEEMDKLRSEGVKDMLALGGGGCRICEECTYPMTACRHPDLMMMSASGTGIDVEKYVKSQGLDFKFENDAFTLYGPILYNRP